jgi:EmrB/QacA subfamily drug resistance transporter
MSVEGAARTRWLVLASMTLANAMILVDQTAVPLALPDIMRSFHTGAQRAQWVLSCSLLPLAGLLVFGGRLGDLIGLRRVFVTGAALFTGASAIGGMAPDLPVLLAARVAQGAGGALLLPTTVAIVSATFPPEARGRALGTMGGAAAALGALGPTIGGTLTSAFSWRLVLLVNVPLAIVTVLLALRHVPAGRRAGPAGRGSIDVGGTALLSIALVGVVLGLSQSQAWGWGSPGVIGPLIAAALAAVAFVGHERRARVPLVDFGLLRHRNYLGATLSQLLGGMAEIGLGVIFPLLLILNLTMDPALAGLALIPTTLPMIVVAPLAGRWYDRAGGRPPLVTGYALLAVAGVMLAIAADGTYLDLLPGLLVFGVGLSLVLTTNDPVSLDTIAERDQGQAAGVSATAEQFGGALGIAVLYSIFHATYLDRLVHAVDRSSLPDLDEQSGDALRRLLQAAESTGLRPDHLDPDVLGYVELAGQAAARGYAVVFLTVAALAVAGAVVVALMVRKPAGDPEAATGATASPPTPPPPAGAPRPRAARAGSSRAPRA